MIQVLFSFRQDGIARSTRTVDERYVIPYAASRFERHKFKIYLYSALPTSTVQFSFGDLSPMEQVIILKNPFYNINLNFNCLFLYIIVHPTLHDL